MNKRNIAFSNTLVLVVLALMVGFSSCKNKKKVGEISDPKEVKEQIEEEISDYEEAEEVDREVVNDVSKTQKLNLYFSAIANAPSAQSANSSISEALTMFSNPDVPVLIVIYSAGGTTDYDEPTTIKKYLEYLKDTKNNKAQVEEMVMDDYGRIKELVLQKQL